MNPIRIAVVMGLVLGGPLAARATTLVAPFIFASSNTFIVCQVTNGGTSTAKIAVTGRGSDGAAIGASNYVCGADLAPGASCYVSFALDADVSCNFDVKGKVRAAGVLYDFSSGRPLSALPATK